MTSAPPAGGHRGKRWPVAGVVRSLPAIRMWCGLAAVFAMPLLASAEPGENLSSQSLTTRAWEALAAGNQEAALEVTAKCYELYAVEASRQQASLKDFLPAEKGHDAWALNDVGTCLFIEGQACEKAGRRKDAAAAYRRLIDDYGFAQCWDPKGWFWKPADAAAERLEVLEFDATLTE
jgi:hypothetical protein